MIVYLDTSALVKLFVDEPGRDAVRRVLKRARSGATGLVTYVELRSALARAARRGVLGARAMRTAQDRFEQGWYELDHVSPDWRLIQRAGGLAADLDLRGYDAVHLASAERLRSGAGDMRLLFACFDDALNRAARLLGFEVLGGEPD